MYTCDQHLFYLMPIMMSRPLKHLKLCFKSEESVEMKIVSGEFTSSDFRGTICFSGLDIMMGILHQPRAVGNHAVQLLTLLLRVDLTRLLQCMVLWYQLLNPSCPSCASA